jgi:hypothetical protein
MSHPKYLILAVLVAMAGCGSEPAPEQAAAAPPSQAPQPAKPADDPVARMARAVGGKPGAAVELRYEMLSKPDVGIPTQVQIVLIPNAGVESMTVTISGMEGVTVSGELEPNFAPVEQGKPYTHTFSLLANRAGVYYLTVSVNSQMGGSNMGRTFSIPLVVGTVQPQAKPQPPKDATGQPIQSMKAEEGR